MAEVPAPLITVVMIFLNAERFIAEAIESVRQQTLKDWELVLVDDGSSDGSSAIARSFAQQDCRIRYIDHPGHVNRGASASRNVGAASSSAEFLAFIDADDVWVPEKLAEQVSILRREPDLAMVCGALRYWSSWDPAATEADRTVLTGNLADQRLDPPAGAVGMYPLTSAPGAGVDFLVRRRIFADVGGFEDAFPGLYDDQSFLLKVYLRHSVFFSARIWLWYRQHGASLCATTLRSDAEYRRLRDAFLRWLQKHVRDHGLGGAEVRRALRRALVENRLRGWWNRFRSSLRTAKRLALP